MNASCLYVSLGEVMSSHLASELEKQKQLYEELLRKTEQLQKLQTVSLCPTYIIWQVRFNPWVQHFELTQINTQ